MAPKNRGGRLQRAARAEAAVRQSNLAHFLTLQTLWGFCSIQQAQKIAALASKDVAYATHMGQDFSFKDLDTIAKLGTDGRHSRNMYTEFIDKLDPPHFQPHVTALPMKLLGSEIKPYDQHMLLPHETFATLYHAYPSYWKERILPQQESLQRFWAQMSDHPMMVDHPVRARRNWAELAVPLSIHGDGVP